MKLPEQSRRSFITSTAVLSVAASVGSVTKVALAQSENSLTVRFYGALDSLDPGYNVGGSPDNDVLWAINPALVHFGKKDGQLTYRPSDYVESITERDPTHIDFTLKPGFMWTNGFGELTAEDVAYSYARMAESEWKGFYDAFETVEVKDKYSGTIVLKQPFAPFIVSTLSSGTGIILSKAATESVGGKFTTDMPATCGPYLYEWKQKQWVKLTPNPEWTGTKPAYDNIDCIFITEDTAAALAYEAGEVEVTKIVPQTFARYKEEMPPDSKLEVAGALQYMWMGMNTEHPKLQDPKVRDAIQYAIDRDAIVQGAYGGTVEPSFGIVCPGLVGKRNESMYSYDPAKSKALLEEAGVTGLELNLRTLNNQERVLTAQIIQANLADVGITVTVLPLDSGPFWEMGQESKGDTWKDLDLWIMRYGAGTDPYEPFQWFLRDQVGIWNWERWSDDEFEELYKKGIAETDPDQRNQIYIRMQEIMEQTGAYVWLAHEPEVYVHKASVDVDLAPSGEMQLLYFKPSA
ncbi:MAG: ABC transporter substrate-binding protein [Pseudomonadota bacterium]